MVVKNIMATEMLGAYAVEANGCGTPKAWSFGGEQNPKQGMHDERLTPKCNALLTASSAYIPHPPAPSPGDVAH